MEVLTQGDKRNLGASCESFIAKMFHGSLDTYNDCFDIETRNKIIEVKSCQAFIRNHSRKTISHSFGRFKIYPENHIGLLREAELRGKDPIYVFVVRVGKQLLFRVLPWDKVHIEEGEQKMLQVAWWKVYEFTDEGKIGKLEL